MEHVEVLRQAIAELRQGSIPALRRATAARKADAAIASLSAQQPAAVDGATIERMCNAFKARFEEYQRGHYLSGSTPTLDNCIREGMGAMRVAAQQGGRSDD